MITLYHCDGARSFRPLWMLEEMGLPYELKMLPFPPRVFAKEYLALNPLGTIPFLVDGETKMTESSGICHYLGIKHGPTPLMVGPEDPAYGAFLNWMYFSDATLTFPQTLVLRYTQLEPEERRNPQVAGDYAKWFLGRLRAVEAATANAEALCAGRFTAADIVIGYALRLADTIGLAKDFGPNVAAYWARLQQRDGFKRAVAAEQTGRRRAECGATGEGLRLVVPAKAGTHTPKEIFCEDWSFGISTVPTDRSRGMGPGLRRDDGCQRVPSRPPPSRTADVLRSMTALSRRDSAQISAKVTSVRSGQRAARGGSQWKITVANPTI